MIISPKRIVQEGIVTDIENLTEQIQQNGIDLTLRTIEYILSEDAKLTKTERYLPQREPMIPSDEGIIFLTPWIYDITFNEYVKIPNGMCAQIVQRSTLNRTWNFITAGVYDAGFENRIGAILHVEQDIWIQIWARLAQIVFFQAEEGDLYNWIYKVWSPS